MQPVLENKIIIVVYYARRKQDITYNRNKSKRYTDAHWYALINIKTQLQFEKIHHIKMESNDTAKVFHSAILTAILIIL